MASQKRLFNALAKKATELGYEAKLIKIEASYLTLWHSEDDEQWSDDLDDWTSQAQQMAAMLSEFCTEALYVTGDHYKTVIKVSADVPVKGDFMNQGSMHHY